MKKSPFYPSLALISMLALSLMRPPNAFAYASQTSGESSQQGSGSSRGSLPRELLCVFGSLSLTAVLFGAINSSEKENRFRDRYQRKTRAMRRDFKRLSGEHF